MKITWVRIVSQSFFLILLLWLCFVTTFGDSSIEMRGWPVNLFLQLDPLISVATLISTGAIFTGLWISLFSVMATLLFGRVFCGWVCPIGSVTQFAGYIARSAKKSENINSSRHSRASSIKYFVLAFLLAWSAPGLLARLSEASGGAPSIGWAAATAGICAFCLAAFRKALSGWKQAIAATGVVFVGWSLIGQVIIDDPVVASGTLAGLVDPMSIAYRTVDLIFLPLLNRGVGAPFASTRLTSAAVSVGVVSGAVLVASFIRPRLFCRYVCPTGALFGLMSRFSLFRIGQNLSERPCSGCRACESRCQGGCEPSGKIVESDCLACLNCRDDCPEGIMEYGIHRSDAGTGPTVDRGRRGFIVSIVAGATALPVVRLSGGMATAWDGSLIRPPGALREDDLLARCVKCGQCMRICPTNVLQPAGLNHGIEAVWTPSLNMKIGTSGCQLNCTACSRICPTGAIRPISLDEKLGRGRFEKQGPIRIGMAFVDRNRCLPWSFGTPCIVCQENCPVSPKAITLDIVHDKIPDGRFRVVKADGNKITPDRVPAFNPDGGDHFVVMDGRPDTYFLITGVTATAIDIDRPADQTAPVPAAGDDCRVVARLQRPVINARHCIGCGTCEHECPVTGVRAIRVSAENETRDPERAMLSHGRKML